MTEAQPRKTAEVFDFTVEHAKREQEKAKLREAKEKYGDLAFKIQNDAMRPGAMREDFMKWRALQEATAGTFESDEETVMTTDVDIALREAFSLELDRMKQNDPMQELDTVTHILSAYTDDTKKDTYPLMRYLAAANRLEILTEGIV